MPEMVTAREAAILLCGYPNYSLVQWHARQGRLQQVKVSARKRFYARAEVLKVAKEYATARQH